MKISSVLSPLTTSSVCLLALVACNEQRAPSTDGQPDIVILDDTGDVVDEVNLNPDAVGDSSGLDAPADSALDADDVSEVIDDAAPDVVVPPGCGDGLLDADEECDNGDENGDASDACRLDCTLARCGDGIVDTGEACDSGDAADASCRADCTIPVCGDGQLDEGEQCDDGNNVDTDGCSNSCLVALAALCLPCDSDSDCGADGNRCVGADSGNFCGTGCEAGCPAGFACAEVATTSGETASQCVPVSGTCAPCLDVDGDSYGIGPECAGFDCNDDNELAYPGASESCDGVDNNCDGEIDNNPTDGVLYYADVDNDGFGNPARSARACAPSEAFLVTAAGDCNDADALVYPGAPELCDGLDNDCDGSTVDGFGEDNFGDACDGPDANLCATGSIVCRVGALVCNEVATTTPELCDGIDNDCNPATPDGAAEATLGDACDGADADECENGTVVCRAGALVCGDDVASGPEVCDGRDNDCDGLVDNDAVDAPTWYLDGDGDGFGDPESALVACSAPDGYIARGDDCDDDNNDVYPGNAELCDGADNNCDDQIDNDPIDGEFYYIDGDGDGYGSDASIVLACEQPDGTTLIDGDCNDESDAINPDATELCGDGVDNNCDGLTDCGDPACADVDACSDDSCASVDLASNLGRVATGNNFTAANNATASCGGAGGDVVFSWRAPAAGRYRFDTSGSAYDTVLYAARGGCSGAEAACNDNIAGGTTSRIFVDVAVGELLIVVVDGAGFTSRGNYVLNIAATEICNDAVDNDGDSFVDCRDFDCELDSFCCPADVWEPNQGVTGSISTLYRTYLTNPDATLTLRPGDVDSFNLPVCVGAEIDASAIFTNAGGNIDLVLRNGNSQVVAISQSTTSNGERIQFVVNTLPPDSRLFLQAYMPTSATTCNEYVLDIEVAGCD